jgi:hypothetical protein
MQVRFAIGHERKRICVWTADLGKRRIVPGPAMGYGDGVPHDLVQYVIEAATGYRNGFWELVARGATFKSTGRRRTKPGRALIARHRGEIDGSERLAATHVTAWQNGERSPVTELLDAAAAQWRSLRLGDELVFEWPSPVGAVRAQLGP